MIHTVFFDAGGTLVKAPDIFERLAKEMGVLHGRDALAKDFFSLNKGRFGTVKEHLKKAVTELQKRQGGKAVDVAAIYTKVFLDEVELYAGAEATLAALKKRKILLYLVADADADVLKPQLEKLGIAEYFDGAIISSEVGAYKPGKRFLEKARTLCREPLEGVLLVGDRDVDQETARGLGIRGILFQPGPGRKKNSEQNKIYNLKDIITIVDTS